MVAEPEQAGQDQQRRQNAHGQQHAEEKFSARDRYVLITLRVMVFITRSVMSTEGPEHERHEQKQAFRAGHHGHGQGQTAQEEKRETHLAGHDHEYMVPDMVPGPP